MEVIRVCASALPLLKKKISADSYKKLLEKFSATAGLDEVEKIVLEEHMMGANEYLKRMKDALRKRSKIFALFLLNPAPISPQALHFITSVSALAPVQRLRWF